MSDVVIAGAGIAGLACALAFRKTGHRVTILERTPSLRPVGAGILIQANGLLVLDALGLGDEVRAAGVAMPEFLIRDRRGLALMRTGLAMHLPPRLWPVSVSRADLHDILWRACAAHQVTLDLGCTVISQQAGELRCVTSRGTSWVTGDLVVGADGVNSAVRETGSFTHRFWPVIEGSVQGIAPFPVPSDCHGEYVGGGQACGLLPLGEGKTFWFWGGSGKAVSGISELAFADWKHLVCKNFPAMRPVLYDRHDWPGAVRLIHRSVQCGTWSAGNVVLIGDAAHAMSPNLGQGANCALVDALTLVSHLGTDWPQELSAVLGQFERQRRPLVEKLQKRGHRDGKTGVQNWPGAEQMFNLTLRLARFAPRSSQRAEVRLVSGLTGNGFGLDAAGITTPLPWQDNHNPAPS